ncbi:MAG TPA: hypothetical protein VNL71_07000, partial [Chloroflexota bacterium]|nr:hypothetical protein [Chloroflexota bacterium]
PELAGALLRAAPVIGLPLKDETRARLAAFAGEHAPAALPTHTQEPTAPTAPVKNPSQKPTRTVDRGSSARGR